MTKSMAKAFLITTVFLLFSACSSTPEPDYRYEEQKRGADKAQKELSREINRRY